MTTTALFFITPLCITVYQVPCCFYENRITIPNTIIANK
jgi:hypothetical protein